MEKLKIKSVDKNLRLCILENSIFIEELISEVVGEILGINWKESKSFGIGSSALSFAQKVQIIQDIKGIGKEDIKKLTCLLNIRNKFAHVSYVATFCDLFSTSKVGKEIKSELAKWYFDKAETSDIPITKHELAYRLCFYMLIDNIVDLLFKIIGDHYYNLGKKDGENEFKEKLINELIQHLKGQEGGIEIINQAINSVKQTFQE